jgi:hypothetical protein
MGTPLSVLRESIKAVPAVKYALGLAGIVAVLAIIRAFGIDYKLAFIGIVVMFFLMAILVIFAKLADLATPIFHVPALVLTWFSLLLLIAVAITLFTSVFFKRPVDLQAVVFPAVPKYSGASDAPAPGPVPASGPTAVPQQPLQPILPASGLSGPDAIGASAPVANENCPEVAVTDFSKSPPESHVERVCN